MAKASLGGFTPGVLFLGFGFLFALIALFAGISFLAFFKAFMVTMIILAVLYAIIAYAKKLGGLTVLALAIIGCFAFLGFQTMPTLLPFQMVPLAIVPTPPGTSVSFQVPDAIVLLIVALMIGLVLKFTPEGKNRPVGNVVLSTTITLFAALALIGGLFFGASSEWMILITPLTGLKILGWFIAVGYVALAIMLWYNSKIAWYVYLVLQIFAVPYALWLGQYFSIIFSALILVYLLFERRKYRRKTGAVTQEIGQAIPI